MSRKNKRPLHPSFSQMRQRELAWMLYITEGYIANLDHCMVINQVTFTKAEQEMLRKLTRSAQTNATRIRGAMAAN